MRSSLSTLGYLLKMGLEAGSSDELPYQTQSLLREPVRIGGPAFGSDPVPTLETGVADVSLGNGHFEYGAATEGRRRQIARDPR